MVLRLVKLGSKLPVATVLSELLTLTNKWDENKKCISTIIIGHTTIQTSKLYDEMTVEIYDERMPLLRLLQRLKLMPKTNRSRPRRVG